MRKLSSFKPVLGACSQGQKKQGVNRGASYVYNHIFKDICEADPMVIQHEQFNNAAGYLKLYQTCHRLNKPLTIGGDHSVASSSVLASLQKFRDLNVIWVDAHPDINTYTSTMSGNTHGTPLSICVGLEEQHWASRMSLKELDFDKITYCGIRDIDDFEGHLIHEKNIRHLDVAGTIKFIKSLDSPIHISFDVDALDPSLVCSTGTPVPGGLLPSEVRAIIEAALEKDTLVSLDVVEFNTELGDRDHSILAVKDVFDLSAQSVSEDIF